MLRQNVKKNCMLCMGRSRLNRPNNPEKDDVQDSLKELYAHFETNGYIRHATQILKKLSRMVKKANVPASIYAILN